MAILKTKVKNLQASYSRTRGIREFRRRYSYCSIEILWPDTTYTSTKISIFNGETLVWGHCYSKLIR